MRARLTVLFAPRAEVVGGSHDDVAVAARLGAERDPSPGLEAELVEPVAHLADALGAAAGSAWSVTSARSADVIVGTLGIRGAQVVD